MFSHALAEGMDDWWGAEGIDLRAMFGVSWQADVLAVARYYVKNLGCQMADCGVRPPASMRRFLDGEQSMEDVGLYLVKSESHYAGHHMIREFGPNVGLFRPTDHVRYSPSRKAIAGYEAATLIGYVGVVLKWEYGSRDHDSFYYHPFPVLNTLPADPDFAEELASLIEKGDSLMTPVSSDPDTRTAPPPLNG